jgi:hypothetical protein
MRLYLNRLIAWLDAAAGRMAERIAFGLLDRFGDGAGLDEAQRAWLLEDVKEDLAAMVDDLARLCPALPRVGLPDR